MSAYICSPEHFQALGVFAAWKYQGTFRVDPRYVDGLKHPDAVSRGFENLTNAELATLYANTLYAENVRSVSARYPNDAPEQLPGPINRPDSICVTWRHFESKYYVLSPIAILKMCDGLEYQSCETEDWEQSVAYKLLTAIRKAAIRKLDGYDDAPWSYDLPENARKAA